MDMSCWGYGFSTVLSLATLWLAWSPEEGMSWAAESPQWLEGSLLQWVRYLPQALDISDAMHCHLSNARRTLLSLLKLLAGSSGGGALGLRLGTGTYATASEHEQSPISRPTSDGRFSLGDLHMMVSVESLNVSWIHSMSLPSKTTKPSRTLT
eukprot:5749477-Amphidinium_carterae.3